VKEKEGVGSLSCARKKKKKKSGVLFDHVCVDRTRGGGRKPSRLEDQSPACYCHLGGGKKKEKGERIVRGGGGDARDCLSPWCCEEGPTWVVCFSCRGRRRGGERAAVPTHLAGLPFWIELHANDPLKKDEMVSRLLFFCTSGEKVGPPAGGT